MKTDQGPDETRPPALISVNDKLPYLGQWVMVEAPSVRCLGFLDANGGWRDAYDHHIIENVRSWYPEQHCPANTFGE